MVTDNVLFISKKTIDILVKTTKGGSGSKVGENVHFYMREGMVGVAASNGHILSMFEGPSDNSIPSPGKDQGVFMSVEIEALRRYKNVAPKMKHVCFGITKSEETGYLVCTMASVPENFPVTCECEEYDGARIISLGRSEFLDAKSINGDFRVRFDPKYLDVPSRIQSVPGYKGTTMVFQRKGSELSPMVMTAFPDGDTGVERFVYILMPMRD